MGAHPIHHVTAIAGPARRNLDFYTRVLGLRLVKRTVNFDDPGTYHFYFGDEAGAPGSLFTTFPWEHAAPGRLGTGEAEQTAFRIPESALGFWTQRLIEAGARHDAPRRSFGETVLPFQDPDGMRLALVAVAGIEDEAGWATGQVSREAAIRGLHGVSLLLDDKAATASILTDVLGFVEAGSEGSVTRYRGGSGAGSVVDLHEVGGFPRGRPGAGTVHHVAFRARDDADQASLVAALAERHGLHTTEQRDRTYFRSVYVREPGGVLFEIATDEPGFAVDEPQDALGTSLKLPPRYEASRQPIEAALPDLG